MSMSYSSIPDVAKSEEADVADDEHERQPSTGHGRRWTRTVLLSALLGALAAVVITAMARSMPKSSSSSEPAVAPSGTDDGEEEESADEESAAGAAATAGVTYDGLPMPSGVNLGSWLSLEDYFFVGDSGATYVATPDGSTVGACLPPLHQGQQGGRSGPRWNSETDLLGNLTRMTSLGHAVRVFHAFRASFIDWDADLPRIRSMGIKYVRVPMSWCLTDFDPAKDDLLARTAKKQHERHSAEEEAIIEERYTCRDPYHVNDDGTPVRWPAVPRPFVASFLRACAQHGIGALLDIHTYPGGTSPGTFSGVWPRKPEFWNYDEPSATSDNPDLGRTLFADFLSWIEGLRTSDPRAFDGLYGITPMNEPAHLAGIFDYLRPLPDALAKSYLAELDRSVPPDDANATSVPDGPHLRVFLWQRDAVDAFRRSSLPRYGKACVVNIHESVLSSDVTGFDDDDEDTGRYPTGAPIVAAWWRGTTTASERATWAVLDMHHYHAWDPKCAGSVDGAPYGNYSCSDPAGRAETLGRCAAWATSLRAATDAQGLGGARLASGEFSASTNHRVRHSCVDVTTLHDTYVRQVTEADEAGIEMYWWSYKMPYGGAFRPAWSFEHFTYRLGLQGARADVSEFKCGEYVSKADGAPDDDFIAL